MAPRAVVTTYAGSNDHRKKKRQSKAHEKDHLDPARHARTRLAVTPDRGRVWLRHGFGIAGRVGHTAPQVGVGSPSKYTKQSVYCQTMCLGMDIPYTGAVPKLWDETIEAHRREVRHAILRNTGALVAEQGLLSITMSQIAENTGIGRATLYKYFPDVEAILLAWHESQIADHLAELVVIRDRGGNARQRLDAVLEAYALLSHQSHGHNDTELGALLHRDRQVMHAQHQVRDFVRDLLIESVEGGDVRDDVAPEELATYCLHSLSAAASLPSVAAVRRLLRVTVAGLRPQR